MRTERPSRQTAMRMLGMAWILLFGGPVFAIDVANQSTADSLGAAVDSMRVHAQYSEAARLASALLVRLKADLSVRPYQIADAERLIGTLQFAAALPESSRRELATADGLTGEIERAYNGGKYADGERKVERQLEIRRRLLGEEHPAVATSLNNLALLLGARGDYAGAEPLFRESLSMRRKLLGGEHPEVATSLDFLATLLQNHGDYTGAEPLYWESLAIYRKTVGEEHPDVARILNDYATLLQNRGDYAGAEPLLRESLAMYRKFLGEEHRRVALSLNNLGSLLRARGDYAGAEPLFREALAMERKLLGEEHPYVALTLNNLALTWQARGDDAGAEPLFREAVALFRKLFSEGHPYLARSLNNLALLLQARGDYAGAELLQRESLTMRRKLLGEDHPDVAASLHNLALLLQARGDYAGAEPLFREAVAQFRKLLGKEHPGLARSLHCLALLLLAQGDYVGAEPLLAEAAHSYEAARLRAGGGMERATFLKASPYPALAATRLILHRHAEAWPAVERAQARVLADLLLTAESRHLTATEARQEDSLRMALGDLQRQLTVFRQTARADSSEQFRRRVEETRDHLLAVEAEWSGFEQSLAEKYPVTEGQVFDLARVQAALGTDEAIVGWLDAEVGKGSPNLPSWGYVIRSTGPVEWWQLAEGHASAFLGEVLSRAGLDGPAEGRGPRTAPATPGSADGVPGRGQEAPDRDPLG